MRINGLQYFIIAVCAFYQYNKTRGYIIPSIDSNLFQLHYACKMFEYFIYARENKFS